MKCPNCGVPIDEGLETCPACGMALQEPVQEASGAAEDVGPQGVRDAVDEEPQDIDDAWVDEEPQDIDDAWVEEAPREGTQAEPEVSTPQPAPAQAPFDSTPEPFVVLTSSAMNGIQQRCPHCGAVVYAGMRRCSRCGRRLIDQEMGEDDVALKAAPLHEYKRFVGNKGAILIILLVLAGGYFVAQLVPRLIAPLINDAPTIAGDTQSIDHEINEYLESGQEAEPEPEPEPTKASAQSFPLRWQGTYEGAAYSDGSGTITCGILFTFDSVKEDGSITGTCEAGFGDFDPNDVDASYKLAGNVNWETGEIHLQGTEWVFSGEIERMRQFNGTVDFEAGTISGTAAGTDGSSQGPWQMRAN